jgi:uncharacterized protein (DUF488 family)
MVINTVGFTQKSAESFFSIIRANNINIVIDVRLNNASQLAGFSKGKDLEYFLSQICGCHYIHEQNLAPTKELFDNYRDRKIKWPEFEFLYKQLITERGALDDFYEKYTGFERVCLLCSEPTAEHCHRGLLCELLKDRYPRLEIKHL